MTMIQITDTQIRAAIARENAKLARQQEAAEATRAMIAILQEQLDQLQKPAAGAKR